MTATATDPSVSTTYSTPEIAPKQLSVRRPTGSQMNEFWPMLNIGTLACPKCAHTFLRYANSCPECGHVTRRKKRSRIQTKAVLASFLGFVTAGFFISEIPVADPSLPAPASNYAVGAAASKSSRKQDEAESARRLLMHQAGMEKLRTGSLSAAQ